MFSHISNRIIFIIVIIIIMSCRGDLIIYEQYSTFFYRIISSYVVFTHLADSLFYGLFLNFLPFVKFFFFIYFTFTSWLAVQRTKYFCMSSISRHLVHFISSSNKYYSLCDVCRWSYSVMVWSNINIFLWNKKL